MPWFTLKSVPGIGNLLFRRLVDRFGSPEQVLAASMRELAEVDGISERTANAIDRHVTPEWVWREMDLAWSKGYRIVTMADPNYPAMLAQIPDPPPILYMYGAFENPPMSIAIVGSREATRYGVFTARRLGRELAGYKTVVVSGLARGIDTAAHMGALDGRGMTVAVMGSGLERVYPSENRNLFHRIAENGAVISEFRLTTQPEARNFPIRNRIISGMTMGTVVVEAARKSGSLITARLAGEQGREVFAVPGNVNSFKSAGTHGLIKQGAKLVEKAGDILEEFPAFRHRSEKGKHGRESTVRPPPMSESEAMVFKELGPYPIHIDDLVRKLAMDPGKLSGILLQLELKGIVSQAPGKMFMVGL